METLEQEPTVVDEGARYPDDPDRLCHLYLHDQPNIALCGFQGSTHAAVPWTKGITKCPQCGNAMCMDCTLIIS